MKYITTKRDDGFEELFLFPTSVNHDAMAEALFGVKNQTGNPWYRMHRKAISAGFVADGKCYGRSMTLDLVSREAEDTALLQAQRI